MIEEKNRDERQRFSIRKLTIGAASVLVGVSFFVYGGQSAQAATESGEATSAVVSEAKNESTETQSETVENDTKADDKATEVATDAAKTVTNTDSVVDKAAGTSLDTTIKEDTAKNVAVESDKNDAAKETADKVKSETGDAVVKADEATKAEDSAEATVKDDQTKVDDSKTTVKNRDLKVDAKVLAAAEADDTNSVNVTTAQELMNALQSGTATTINIANNINMGDIKTGENINVDITNKRNITIQSSGETKNTVDFNGYSFKMNSNDYGVTFKNITLYGRSYFGIVRNAGSYTFDNVDYTGSQLVYTEPGYNSTVSFNGTVNVNSVASYVGLNGTSYKTQGKNGNQQVLQFRNGTNNIVFESGSNVHLKTVNSNVIEIDGGTTTIDVKSGANVTLEPHTTSGPESDFMNVNGISRGIASKGTTKLNIEKDATLTIPLTMATGDNYLSSAMDLESGATINNNGTLMITSEGTPHYQNNGWDDPVYINGGAQINVGDGAIFNLEATNLGDFKGHLMTVSGTGTVSLDPHSTFKISGDGTGALTAINLSSGSTFTSDQPKEFTIDLSANTNDSKSLIKNGTIDFTRVKNTNVDEDYQKPLGMMTFTYDGTGKVTSYTISSQDEGTTTEVANHLKSDRSNVRFVAAGEDVTLSDVHLSKDNKLTGTVSAPAEGNSPIYIWVEINGKSVELGNNPYTVYTDNNGNITSSVLNAAGSTGNTGGQFEIDLSSMADQLTNDAKISVVATRYFVDSKTIEGTVADFRKVDTTTLQDLVDEEQDVKSSYTYYNAPPDAQVAYHVAVAAGNTILDNISSGAVNYDQSDIDAAVTAIQDAKKVLTGEATNKDALQDAVNAADTTKASENYTNSDANLQKAYTDAITAGQTVLDKENATQTEVDNALSAINAAKTALNGDAKKATSKEALQQAVDEAPTVKESDAAYYNGTEEAKKAYDDAVSAGQKVLDNSDATAAQITDALNAINTAKGNLKGEATDKSALQQAVNNSATVKESNNYTNADETQKTAYDNAITAAQKVLDNTNATQAEVNEALQNLETANNNLNGDAKTEAANKAALEAAVKEAPTVRETPAYYNGSSEAQTAYNSAISAGQAVLDKENPTASEVKDALDAINAAKGNLNGEATNIEALETALTTANNAKGTGNYTNSDQAKQEALTNAINAGQEVLKNTKATQAEVDAATKAITDAINGLNGDTNLENAKNAATEDIQKALDAKTTEITAATNIDQDEKDKLINDATDAANAAKEAIDKATTADAIKKAQDEGTTNINNVNVPSLEDAKNAATKVVDEALTKQTEVINGSDNLSDSEKQDLIKQVTDAANEAKDKINSATTNDGAAQAGQDGKAAIEKVVPTSLEDAKNAATKVVDDALTKQTEVINGSDNLSDSEKQDLIKQVTDAANEAKGKINAATTNDGAAQAGQDGKAAIEKVAPTSLEDAKDAATKVVDEALTKQTEVINGSDNLSDSEKQDLIKQATDAANEAKDKINAATTNDDAVQAGQDGKTAIEKVVPTSLEDAKKAASQVVDDALNKKLDEIKANTNLTDEEKAKLESDANSAAATAKENIAKATTNDAATQAGQDGKTAIEAVTVPTDSGAKKAAKEAIDEAAKTKNDTIDASDLTTEEKTALKEQVADAAKAAKDNIDAATKSDDVSKAQKDGENAINDIAVPDSAVKTDAIDAINTALADKKTAINGTNLTDEEKAALVEKAQKLADDAIAQIKEATTNDAVTTAKENGVQAIKDMNVPTNSDAKQKATASIDEAAEAAKNAIENTNGLTDSEKQAAKNQVDADATAAKNAINDAKTNDAVTEAINNGTVAINKDAANAAIDGALAEKNNAIDAVSELTTEEKQAVKDEAKTAADNAKTAINNATTVSDVETAKNTGIENIKNVAVPTESQAKNDAITAIDEALKQKTAAIEKADYLTDEEKTSLTNQAKTAADNAKTAINSAADNDAVKAAKEAGVSAINAVDVPSTSAVKDAAIKVVEEAAEAKRNAVNNAPNLTQDEKQEIIDEVNAAEKTAKDAINSATTTEAVTNAQTTGVDAISKITIPTNSKVKDAAVAEIDAALKTKLAEIDQATKLTSDERNVLITDANNAANTAKEAIRKADTNAAVADAKNAGLDALDKIEVSTESKVKQAAKDAVKQAADTKIDSINNASDLTSEEKADLIKQVNDIVSQTNNNIDEAPTNADVETAKNTGISSINGITIPSTSPAKDQANSDIDKAAEDAKKAIDEIPGLTEDQKQAAKNQVDEDAKTAKDNINNATSDEDVKKVIDDGLVAIDKNTAKAAVDGAAAVKNNQINNSNLTSEEKQNLIDQVNNAANDAKGKIDSATTQQGVTDEKNTGIENINKVTVPENSQAKQDAIKAIDDAADAKKEAIKNAPNLTDEEKQSLVDQVNNKAQEAKDKIDSATTDTEVTDAKTNGVNDINKVTVPESSQAKQDAIKAIDDAADAKKEAIKNAPNLTSEEKKSLTDQVDQAATDAKKNINDATNDLDVDTAKNEGLKKINDLDIPTDSKVKDAAIAEIDAALNKKLDEINNATALTADEKNDLIKQANNAADQAKDAIRNAISDTAVEEAKNTGINNINNVEVSAESAVKNAAKDAVQNKADSKINDINNAANLTKEEKAELVKKVNDIASNAKENIDNSSTNQEVATARDNGISVIEDINIPSTSSVKDQANNDIDKAAEDAKKAIDQTPGLTDDQKQTAKDQIDQDAKEAKDNINNATDDQGVKDATDAGKLAIDKVTAKAAIDSAAAAKKSEIAKAPLTTDEANTLNNEVDQEATAAKAAIDSATTNNGVESAKNTGIETINNIKIPTTSETKDQAKTDITNSADEAKKAIDQDSNLTDDQKQAAKDQIDSDAKKAQDAIDNAKSDEDVKNAVDNGKLAIDKDVANAAIDNAAAGKKKEISDSSLTDEEKAALNNEVDQKANDAKNAIKEATTSEAVETAKNDGIKNINSVEVPSTSSAKDKADKAIDEALANKTKEINDASNLSDNQKQDLINQANEEAEKAKEAIKNATTDEAVTKAEKDGVDAIDKIKIPTTGGDDNTNTGNTDSTGTNVDTNTNSDTSTDDKNTSKDKELADHQASAIDEITKAANNKKSEIDGLNVSDDEKSRMKNLVDQEAAKAIENIKNAKSAADVDAAKKRGVESIESITPKRENLSKDKKSNRTKRTNSTTASKNRTKEHGQSNNSNVNGSALAATNNKNSKNTLPETGSRNTEGLTALGLLAIGAVGLISLLSSRKKKH